MSVTPLFGDSTKDLQAAVEQADRAIVIAETDGELVLHASPNFPIAELYMSLHIMADAVKAT